MIKQIIYYIVAGLVRVSTIMQYETGRSIDIQPARIAQFVQSEGIGFYKIFEEPGISGRKAQRKVIAELLRDARAGKFNLLVVTDVSRFFRNLEALLSTIRELKSYGVDFVPIMFNSRRRVDLAKEQDVE